MLSDMLDNDEILDQSGCARRGKESRSGGHVPCTLTVVTLHRGSFSPIGPINVHCIRVLLSCSVSLLVSSGRRSQLECSGLPSLRILAVILSWLIRPRLFRFVGFFLSRGSVRSGVEGFLCLGYSPLPVDSDGFIVPLSDCDRLRS